jgi:hypothetical protein
MATEALPCDQQTAVAVPYNKRMQRARDPDKCVLCWPHQRVADAQR